MTHVPFIPGFSFREREALGRKTRSLEKTFLKSILKCPLGFTENHLWSWNSNEKLKVLKRMSSMYSVWMMGS